MKRRVIKDWHVHCGFSVFTQCAGSIVTVGQHDPIGHKSIVRFNDRDMDWIADGLIEEFTEPFAPPSVDRHDGNTIDVLKHIQDLLEPDPPPTRACVRKAWALAYAETERLSKIELDSMLATRERLPLTATFSPGPESDELASIILNDLAPLTGGAT